MSWTVRIAVELESDRGRFLRVSDPVPVETSLASTLALYDGLMAYPDRRAVRASIYSSDDDTDWYLATFVGGGAAQVDLTASTINNVAYATLPADVNLTVQTAAKLDLTTASDRDRDPNRVFTSEVNKPLYMPAGNTELLTMDDADRVQGFAANVTPVGASQYGFAPVIVGNRKTVHTLNVGTETVWQGSTLIATKGVASRTGITNANGVVYFISDDGIWTIAGRLGQLPVSSQLQDSAGVFEAELVGRSLTYVETGRGRRELWLHGGPESFVLSVDYGRWFTATRSRAELLAFNNVLYGSDGVRLYDEMETLDIRPIVLRTQPIRFDGYWARIEAMTVTGSAVTGLGFKLYDRGTEIKAGTIPASGVVRLPATNAKELEIELFGSRAGDGQTIDSIDLDVYVNRPARRRTR